MSAAIGIERALKWAEEMNKKWQKDEKKEGEIEITSMLLCLSIGLMLALILTILGSIFWIFQGNTWNLSFASNSIDLFTDEIIITNTTAWVICIVGGLIVAIGARTLREGNSIIKDLDINNIYINNIYYLTPVLSIIWLFSVDLVQLQRRNYFVIGGLIILATSILISVEKDAGSDTGRLGFRGLIVSLWSTGLLIYFREIWIQWPWLANDTPWEWSIGTVDYYSLIVLSATIFILILSFRTSRLIERTNKEEDQYLRMKYMIKKLSLSFEQRGHKANNKDLEWLYEAIKWYLYKLDKDDTKNSSANRDNFRHTLNILRAEIKEQFPSDKIEEESEKIYDLELEFDLLHRSKQRGRYLAENLVLYIFALVTIMVTIGTRPTAVSAWNALLIDILAFLFSSAICFMTINLIDLRAYREQSTEELMNTEETGERTKDAINQKAVQVISIILAVVISTAFLVLLYDKWMGIWFL